TRQEVSLGARVGNEVVIESGVEIGDKIVVQGIVNMRDGVEVKEIVAPLKANTTDVTRNDSESDEEEN
ncbi:hypothetical protein OFN64_27565, partial [Escherichia coli]|nr:hypothetical protein [Escherichia coli]